MKQRIKELRYALYLTVHPFKGFWDIKYEKEGSFLTAMILLAATIIVQIVSSLKTGYLFGGITDVNYNMVSTITSSLFLFFSWCIANWCLTCLSDGKGTFKDIMTFTSYSLTPYIIIQTIMVIISNMFILREQVFYTMLNGLSLVWVGFLLVTGMLTTHHFTLRRTVVVVLATIVGMVVIAVLILLVFSMFQQVVSFASIVFDEFMLRVSY